MKQIIKNIRNYTALVYTWLVLVWMASTLLQGGEAIAISTLFQLFALSFVGAFLQQVVFTSKLFRKWSFTPKLTVFLAGLVIVESVMIAAFGLFNITTWADWLLFVGVAACMYLGSVGVFQWYSKKTEKQYTAFLQDYKSSIEHKYT